MKPFPGRRTVMLLGAMILLEGCAAKCPPAGRVEEISAGDTAFVLLSAALVMLMTPALSLFYGGLVRSRNVLSVIMQSFTALGLVTLQWMLVGYSLSFAPSLVSVHLGGQEYGLLGALNYAGMRAVGMEPCPVYSATIPHRLFMTYQCMFAIITPALISGAFAERMKFKSYVLFVLLWTTLVYDPVAHWVWSENGWLRKMGALDFAGGTVVHISSGVTALLAAVMIRPRRGFPREAFVPHNLVFTLLGAGLLWFGWFGFNAGSALSAGQVATVAFLATHCAAAGGALAWIAIDSWEKRKPTLLGAASGAVAGLVAVTPASGYVGPLSALVIGMAAGAVCSWAVTWRARKGIDDALDAFGVHGVGGTIGAILTGVFASAYLNSAIRGNEGLIHGGWKLIFSQLIAVAVTIVYTAAVSYVILKVLDLTVGLRVCTDDELQGLDLTQHGENAYAS